MILCPLLALGGITSNVTMKYFTKDWGNTARFLKIKTGHSYFAYILIFGV